MNDAADVRFETAPRVAAKVVMDEAVLIDLETGVYYGIPGTGAVVWELIAAGHTAAEAAARLADAYGVDVEEAARVLDDAVASLLAEGVIVASTREGADRVDIAELAAATEFGAVTVERFDDMEELLALDPPTPGVLDVLMPGADDGTAS